RPPREVLSPDDGRSQAICRRGESVEPVYRGRGNGTVSGRCAMSRRDNERPDGVKRSFALPASARLAERAVEEEFAFHMHERVEELMQGGLSRAEAEREVQRRFGNVDVLKRETTAID